jgi:hypothetical protein
MDVNITVLFVAEGKRAKTLCFYNGTLQNTRRVMRVPTQKLPDLRESTFKACLRPVCVDHGGVDSIHVDGANIDTHICQVKDSKNDTADGQS